MQQFVDSNWRATDGAWAKTFWLPIPLASVRAVASNDIPALAGTPASGILAKDSSPQIEFTNGDTDSAIRIESAANTAIPFTFQTALPPYMDTEQPLYLKMWAAMGGATNTPVISADTFFNVGDTKVEDDSAAITGTTVAQYTITIAAADIPNDAYTVSVELTPGSHANDALFIYALWFEGSVL